MRHQANAITVKIIESFLAGKRAEIKAGFLEELSFDQRHKKCNSVSLKFLCLCDLFAHINSP